MKHMLRFVTLFAMLGLFLVGCGGAVTPEASEPAVVEATEAPTTAPKPDVAVCVKVAISIGTGEATSLDPFSIPGPETAIYINQVYNRLMDLDNDFVLHPELAESWEPNADGTEWTFHLHKGVLFHDGHELTAADVVWTYQRLLDPENPSESLATLSFLKPESIVAVDDYTVKFITDQPVPELPLLITTNNVWIVPEGAGADQLRLSGMGTGPFVPVDFEPVQQPHRFVRNPDYWEKGLPLADCLEFYVISEPTTRLAAVQSGEVDIVEYVDFATIPALKGDPNVTILATSGPSTSLTFSVWVDTPPFDDLRVRQAMKMLVDRQAMIDTVFLGYALLGDDNPIPPASPYAWRTEAEVPARDVEGAIELLAEAGYGPNNPLTVDLYTSDFMPGVLAAAQMFAQQASEAGVVVNIIPGPPADYWDNVWLKQPFLNSGWDPRHPGEALAVAYRSDALYNETHWFLPDYDALVNQASSTIDQEARTELYRQAEKMLTEEGGVIIPLFTRGVAAMRSNCTGYERHIATSRFDLRRATCTR